MGVQAKTLFSTRFLNVDSVKAVLRPSHQLPQTLLENPRAVAEKENLQLVLIIGFNLNRTLPDPTVLPL